jgi:hypothetical protein
MKKMMGLVGEAVNLILDKVSEIVIPEEAFQNMEWQEEDI